MLFGYKPNEQTQNEVKVSNHIILIEKLSISKFKYGEQIDPAFVFGRELCLRKLFVN